jgi:hypothetical protein
MLLLLAQDVGLEASLKDFREKSRADVPCTQPTDDNEIVVCARRDADRYRAPLITSGAGREASGYRMDRLLSSDAAGFVPCGRGSFMVHCGSVGVGVSMNSGGGTRTGTGLRPLAP